MAGTSPKRLKKDLGLFDVFAICTGAMFSSGFFLLPGLAAAQTGPSVVLAYMLAGILMLPAMFSMAELATAMPRAGGDYYFLDRALGPVVGTIGGTGTYFALTLKSAFALIGMGAYLALFMNVPIKPLAISLTVAFMMLNILGAKEGAAIQRGLVVVLISVLAFFVASGLFATAGVSANTPVLTERFTPFAIDGFAGVFGTIGFVFVSYAGLTKIASVSEEIKNPERNIPLGMILSIGVTTFIYVVGVALLVALLEPDALRADLTPIATAAAVSLDWMPGELGVLLVVTSAVAAFASTGNAGILAASRYPLAMGRDRLIPDQFAKVSKKGTPLFSIVVTAGLMIAAILFLNEEGIAKIASGFQLIIFTLVNLTVIVMRESRIEYYDPGYKSPLYPWTQIFGIGVYIALLAFLGPTTIAMTLGVAGLALAWYFVYGRKRVERHGAIYHWFERLGRLRSEGIEYELREILKEKGIRGEDPFEEIVETAGVLDIPRAESFDEIASRAITLLSQNQPMVTEALIDDFRASVGTSYNLDGAVLAQMRLDSVNRSELIVVRVREGISFTDDDDLPNYALFFLVSPPEAVGQHLRVLAQVARHVETHAFIEDWLHAEGSQELKEILLHSERMLTLWLEPKHRTEEFIGKRVSELNMPTGSLIAVVRRNGDSHVPGGGTVLQRGDRITIIGKEEDIQDMYTKYVGDSAAAPPEPVLPAPQA
jgi:amino acid transporter/mannitol/fructose-specific phosphotransferase system IIA component (Ntr-type)